MRGRRLHVACGCRKLKFMLPANPKQVFLLTSIKHMHYYSKSLLEDEEHLLRIRSVTCELSHLRNPISYNGMTPHSLFPTCRKAFQGPLKPNPCF